MRKKRSLFALIMSLVCSLTVEAQGDRLFENVQYGGSVTGTAGGGSVPFWFTNNKYGFRRVFSKQR